MASTYDDKHVASAEQIRKAALSDGARTPQDVVAWAKAQANNPTSNWYRRCQSFVRQAIGSSGGALTATDAFTQDKYKHAGDMNPPAGAAVYWGGGAGHAAISAGNGYVYTTDMAGKGTVSLQKLSDVDNWLGGKHNYLGWTEGTNEVHTTGLQTQPGGEKLPSTPDAATSVDGTTATLDQSELMSQYGWNAAFLNHNPELKSLFQQVVSGQITDQATFAAKLKNTGWWKQHTDTWKTNQALRDSDPAEYTRQRLAVEGTVRQLAGSIGGKYSDTQIRQIAMDAFNSGWTNDEISRNLAAAVDWSKQLAGDDTVGGQAAQYEGNIKQAAAAYGVTVSDKYVAQRVAGILGGKETEDNYKQYLVNVAKQTYSGYAKELDAGHTMEDIAQPYIQSMAQTLELDPNAITLSDPTLRKTLTSVSPEGKPSQVPIWQFEQGLRNDSRWQYTDNARDTYTGLTAALGKTFGKM